MKGWLVGVITAGCVIFSGQMSIASELELPEDTYYWIQSTDRVNYYFNMKELHYGVDDKGFIDLNTLHVITLQTFDGIQVEDVVSKRRWNDLPLDGYDDLVGAVNYMTINLTDGIVNMTKRTEVNSKMEVLDEDTSREPIKLDSLSEKNVEGKFFRGILEYEKNNTEKIIANTNGELSKEDKKKLEKAKKDAEAAAKKAEKEKKKAEKNKKDNSK